jgi:hypothetical protein
LPDFFKPGDLVVTNVKVNGVPRPASRIRPGNFRIELSDEELGSEVVVEFRTRLPQRRRQDDVQSQEGHATPSDVIEDRLERKVAAHVE